MFAALYQVMNATVGLRKKIWISDKSSQKESLNIYICAYIYVYIELDEWLFLENSPNIMKKKNLAVLKKYKQLEYLIRWFKMNW